jgi:hypothetical protein
VATLLAVVALALAPGCGKEKKKAPAAGPAGMPAAMSVEEKTRNADACKDYVAKVCACAQAHPDKADVAERCKLDDALPEALVLSMRTAENPASTAGDVLGAHKTARTIATGCIESLAKLPALGCP